MPNPVMLDRKCTNGQQSLELVSIWNYGDHKLRIRRRRNAYDFQSWALVERWDGTKWQEVAQIPFAAMACAHEDSYVSKAARPNGAERTDEKELLRLAALVL